MFENVTYTFYSDTLGRAVVPSEEAFDELKLTNIQEMKRLLPFLEEREENGIDSAVCMMIEAEYKLNQEMNTNNGPISSENVSGHSVSFDTKSREKAVELNAMSLAETKIKAIRLFCNVDVGVR